jgi:magnesium transporter
MTAEQAIEVIRAMPVEVTAPVLQKMLPAQCARCAAGLDADQIAKLLKHLPSQMGAAILRPLDADARDEALEQVSRAYAAALKLLLRYPPSTIGAWMNPRTMTFGYDYSIREALGKLDEIDHAHSQVIVLDRDRHILGAVPVRALRQHDRSGSISSLLHPADPVWARESIADALKMEIWEHESNIPVINRHSEFVGVISHADLRKGIQQNKTRQTSVTSSQPGGIAELLLTGLACTWQNVEELLIRDVRREAGSADD